MKNLKDIKLFKEMINSYINKKYDKFPVWTMLSIVISLIYILCPIDLIPDFILGFGYVDDGTVFLACLNFVYKDIEKYKIWKESIENEIVIDSDFKKEK